VFHDDVLPPSSQVDSSSTSEPEGKRATAHVATAVDCTGPAPEAGAASLRIYLSSVA
jgi:hypothetical protein